jgi:hypothetical protein
MAENLGILHKEIAVSQNYVQNIVGAGSDVEYISPEHHVNLYEMYICLKQSVWEK